MSQFTLEDFEGLSIKQLTEKLQFVNDIEFLSQLEEREKVGGEPRKGALSAINERQGVLVDQQNENETIENNEEITPEETTPPAPPTPPTPGADAEDPTNNESETTAPPTPTEEDKAAGVKATRLELDKALQFSEAHNKISNDCNENIFLAKAWLGKYLASIGENNPYDGIVKTTADIPPTAEKNEGDAFFLKVREFKNLNTLAGVLALREMLDWSVKRIENLEPNNWAGAVARTQAFVNASEAKFKLGLELAKLRG